MTLNFEYLSNGFAVENPVSVAATDLIIYSDAFSLSWAETIMRNSLNVYLIYIIVAAWFKARRTLMLSILPGRIIEYCVCHGLIVFCAWECLLKIHDI